MARVNWRDFEAAAPELAALATERLEGTGLALVGTLRADGSPRISPVEPYLVDGELMLGMMWQSRKALDLLRDPRVVVHSIATSAAGDEGDVKLYGRAVVRDEPRSRQAYAAATLARIKWEPKGPYHLFALDIASAGYVIFAPQRYGLRWNAGGVCERFDIADDEA